jgi:hypothetical protein
MKRNQKKYTKKNYKGGVVDSNMAKVSLAALEKRLEDIELNLGTIKTKIGEVNPVEGPSREDNTGYGEAGFPEPTVGQNNPMNPDFVSNPSTSGKLDNGSEPIKDSQFDEVDNLTDQIKILQKDPKVNKDKLKTKIGLRNALFNKYKIRYEYLKKEKDARKLSDAETDQYYILESNLNDRSFGGRGKSRRYKKTKRSTRRRTRKYKK